MRTTRTARAALALLLLWLVPVAAAQPVHLPETDDASRDPLGSGGLHDLPALLESETRAIDARARAAAEAALVAAPVEGPVLAAAPGIRESEHDVTVRLATPVTEVRHRIVLQNPTRYRAEVRYVLAVPDDAAITALAVRSGEIRVEGEPTHPERDAYDALALADARPPVPEGSRRAARPHEPAATPDASRARAAFAVDGERGPAIVVDVAPIAPDGAAEIELAYAIGTHERGGVARIALPPRGADLRTVEARLAVESVGLGAPRLWGREANATGEPVPGWAAVVLDADVPSDSATTSTLHRARCGTRACSVRRTAAGRRAPSPEHVIVLLDASPSTLGPARGRIGPAIAALLAEASSASTFQVLAFASRVRALVPEPVAPAAVPFAPLAAATAEELGSATRFEAAWETARGWARERRARGDDVHVVIVGDGGLTDGSAARRAFDESRRDGVRVSVVNVAGRGTRRALVELARVTGGSVVEAGAAAALAELGRSSTPLRERVRLLFAPRVRAPGLSVPLPAGEAHVDVAFGRGTPGNATVIAASAPETAVVGRWAEARLGVPRQPWVAGLGGARVDGEEATAARCGEVPEVGGDPARTGPPLSLAFARACAEPAPPPPPPDPLAGRGVPPEVLLGNLRTRIVPAARSCLRDDRRGRLDYAVRATFVFRLEDREVTRAEVEGTIPPELRACLLRTVDTLDVPRFEGALVVRYPIYTERAEVPPVIELAPDVEDRLRVLFGEPEPGAWPRP